MSMILITLGQLVSIFLAYLCISVLLPHIVLGKTLKLKNRYEKFLVYPIFGNFYVINLVYLLELLHISHSFTLIIFTLVPCAIIKIKLEDIPVMTHIGNAWETLRRLVGGQMGLKAYRDSKKPIIKKKLNEFKEHLHTIYVKRFLDVLGILIILFGIGYVYGVDMFKQYGYKSFDVVVHNYWINSMLDNKIFVTGIYPYGFHSVIYYMRQVFGIDIMASLRLFAFVQTFLIHVELLCFLKLISKTRFLPYLGTYTFLLANFYKENTYYRFLASLPQEFGMIFILPTIYALISYFRSQRRENRGDASNKAKMFLAAFCLGFSVTLTSHFYDAMIVGLYCIAIAIGFAKFFFKKQYFKRIMLTGILSLVITILPMGIAYLEGTPLQQSLYWGLSVIDGSVDKDDEHIVLEEEHKDEEKQAYIEEYGTVVGTAAYTANGIENNMSANVIEGKYYNYSYFVILFPILLLLVGGSVCFIAWKKDSAIYAGILFSGAIFNLFMVIMLNSSIFGLPSLMDMTRGGIFYAYMSTICIVLLADGILYCMDYTNKTDQTKNAISFVCVVAVIAFTVTHGGIKYPATSAPQEMNEAVECLTKIMIKDKPHNWTIVSANDERQMANDKGYHQEIVDFLYGMEDWTIYHKITVPTSTVYFFVEKEPNTFDRWIKISLGRISEEYADNPLPDRLAPDIYEKDNRMILMSRFYQWCEAFRKLYPNEMTIFDETDNFICYRVEQNPYRLFNFAIDYDFNTRDYPITEELDEAVVNG